MSLRSPAKASTPWSRASTRYWPDLETLLLTQDAIYATGNERGNSLVGNSQYNVLSGKAGRDFLYGGRGADILVGGSDRDVFVFRTNDTGSTSSTADVIKDFRPEEGDRIDLSGFDGNSTRAGMQHLRYVEGTFTGRGQVKAITVKDETRLLINIDQDLPRGRHRPSRPPTRSRELVRALSALPFSMRYRRLRREQHLFTLNQVQALSFRGREAEPGTHEHRRLGTVARRLHRRVYGSRALLRSPGMTEPGMGHLERILL